MYLDVRKGTLTWVLCGGNLYSVHRTEGGGEEKDKEALSILYEKYNKQRRGAKVGVSWSSKK